MTLVLTMFALLVSYVGAMSLGAPTCDALGVCASGTCPAGMELVAPPVRNPKYSIRTGDGDAKQDIMEYTPGEIMDIHIRTLDYDGKYIGLLIYAVEFDKNGQYDETGCPTPGCDGSVEVKTGSWIVAPGEPFQQSYICGDQALTHTSATLKNFHHTLHWRAPEAGTGKVIFRAIVKVGPTQGGWFYWPMQKDLVLKEGALKSTGLTWLHGSQGASCKEVCRGENLECDEGSMNGDYTDFANSFVCPLPLLSGCGSNAKAMVWSDGEGDCFTRSSKCASASPQCSAKIPEGERFCACKELTLSRVHEATAESTQEKTSFYDILLQFGPYFAGAGLGAFVGFVAITFCISKRQTSTPLIEDLYLDIASTSGGLEQH